MLLVLFGLGLCLAGALCLTGTLLAIYNIGVAIKRENPGYLVHAAVLICCVSVTGIAAGISVESYVEQGQKQVVRAQEKPEGERP